MKRIILIFSIFILTQCNIIAQDQIVNLDDGRKVILYSDKTWDYYNDISYDFDFSKLDNNQIPVFLRQGINVDKQTLIVAVEHYLQGWVYVMPVPKSKQAYWGNDDGRTTWWAGYWFNNKSNKYSESTPEKHSNNYYYGDDQNYKGTWRNGGSPDYPTKTEWLLSSIEGVMPN
jgi:hypothetical protein